MKFEWMLVYTFGPLQSKFHHTGPIRIINAFYPFHACYALTIIFKQASCVKGKTNSLEWLAKGGLPTKRPKSNFVFICLSLDLDLIALLLNQLCVKRQNAKSRISICFIAKSPNWPNWLSRCKSSSLTK